tara:strand:+ start:18601 stop:18897 length:297 start_codon:yes stop_codon:yes gene_type:complete
MAFAFVEDSILDYNRETVKRKEKRSRQFSRWFQQVVCGGQFNDFIILAKAGIQLHGFLIGEASCFLIIFSLMKKPFDGAQDKLRKKACAQLDWVSRHI